MHKEKTQRNKPNTAKGRKEISHTKEMEREGQDRLGLFGFFGCSIFFGGFVFSRKCNATQNEHAKHKPKQKGISQDERE